MTTRLTDSKLAFLAVLAIVFTVALTFATLEAPTVLNRFFADYLGIPDFNPGFQSELIEEFMNSHYIRPIGYVCLAVLIILIVVGFATKRTGMSALGSLGLFLPTFGYFASYMFFLSGAGMLRVVWLPIWGPSTDLLKLGDIVYLPYMIVVYPLSLVFSLVGIDVDSALADLLRKHRMDQYYWDQLHPDVRIPLAYVLIGLGLLIFFLGTISWFYAKLEKRKTVDFWLYRHSRHPQYLGWLVWSYGLMLLASYTPVPRGGVNPGASFPWLVSSLLVICVALTEEINMTERYGEDYTKYRDSTPFMFPLPNFVSSIVTLPIRILLKKDRPENGKEIIVTFLVYAAILVLLSLPFVILNWPPFLGWTEFPYNTWPFRP
ncbi:MAG: DUF1295 domain-containing protein [Aigarchaeota archaeon]|nr:DUF1295 domain-containing protein [Aigarchaeota archaeon]